MDGQIVALQPGTTLSGGRYEIERVLGQGGFGITYRAADQRLDRDVAIKEFFMLGSAREGTTVRVPEHLRPHVDQRMDRVRDEARALARFRHPGIVSVHEFFEENDSIYVVMELLDGTSLRRVIDEADGPLPEADVLRYGREIATALAAVHGKNLLHRDVKPDNVMVMPEGEVVLVDFGTAREFSADKSSLMSQTLSPGYAPVEQYSERGRFGPSTDLYALGATMYHMATGTFPTTSLDRFTGADLQPPHDLNPQLSPHVSQAIMWAMNLEAEDRPQTAEAFLKALAGGAVPTEPGATRIVPSAAPPPPTISRATAPAASVPPVSPATQPISTGPAVERTPTTGPVVPHRRRRRSRVGRSARRMGRTVANLAITIAIAIGATFAVAWYFNNQSDSSTQPMAPVIREITPAGL